MKKKNGKRSVSASTLANEPKTAYGTSRIQFFNSFEEMNEADHVYYSTLSYNERLTQLNNMLMKIYQVQLKKNPSLGNKIFFD